jgi:hypothetical protein
VTAAVLHICPHCQGTGYSQSLPEAEIEAVALGLRRACKDAGAMITGDDRVDEQTAAMLIGRRPKTLTNWRHTHRPIPYVERCRRISYAVTDIARWLHKHSGDPMSE